MGLRVRKALRLIDIRGDQKTTVGAPSEERSAENDDDDVKIENGSPNLDRCWKNPHYDLDVPCLQKSAFH